LRLVINQSSEETVSVNSGENVRVNGTFINNTNSTVRDIEIEFDLEGAILDKTSVNVGQGFYRSSDNKIIFNKDNTPFLAEIEPRDQKDITFNFRTTKLSEQSVTITNPEVKISSHVKARRVSEDNSEEKIDKTNLHTVQVLSDVFMQSYTLYQLGPFQNTGPVPPKADLPTTYTVLWSVSNSSNKLENSKVTATVPPYIQWNNVASPSGEKISYDSASRKITWDIGNLDSGLGYAKNPKEVNFQVTLTPSVSQIGSAPYLLEKIIFSAKDSFVGKTFEIQSEPPRTILQEQAGSFNKHEIVIQ
jgi:hypothetical protein